MSRMPLPSLPGGRQWPTLFQGLAERHEDQLTGYPIGYAWRQSEDRDGPPPFPACSALVAPKDTSVVALWHTRPSLSALWHPRPERIWPCGTRDQNGSGLVAPEVITRLLSHGSRGRDPRRRLSWRGPINSVSTVSKPGTTVSKPGTMTLGKPGNSRRGSDSDRGADHSRCLSSLQARLPIVATIIAIMIHVRR